MWDERYFQEVSAAVYASEFARKYPLRRYLNKEILY